MLTKQDHAIGLRATLNHVMRRYFILNYITHSLDGVFFVISMSFNLTTLQGRAQSQREIFEAGMSLENIKYFLNYLHDAQTESYIVNLLIECVANRCGCKKD